ncbi:MAG TPA: MotA/TolQ/ExbB proton channel family protein, partial [Bdellovibrionota bacterium]|nr:MotA/TolQ/ExbB proton channel family protein [Bdellovibrionota bacterium]
ASAGAFGVYIAYDRAKMYYKTYTGKNNALFMARIKEFMMQGRFEDAVQYCNMEKGSLLPHVIRAGVERVGSDEAIVRQSMESAYLEQQPKISERVGYLSMVANAGMLFGLLGTVLGLIRQFSALASADVADKQLLMAKGIAEAMNNTALGLMVALPMLVLHGIFSARANKMVEDLERGAAQFLDWVGLYNSGQLGGAKQGNSHGNVVDMSNKRESA